MKTDPFRTVEFSDPAYEHHGLRFATVKSSALGHRVDAAFWVPAAARIDTLLILLHGVYGSHWVWSLKGGAHRVAQQLLEAGEIGAMVLAMPSDALSRDGSAYLDWPGNGDRRAEDVEQWIMEELPVLARMAAPALQPDAKIAIAGLSMGGYGALRLGAKYATRFCAIAAHSAITEIDGIPSFAEEPLSDYLACGAREELSPLHWMLRHREDLPPLHFDCGTGDSLLESNRRLHRALVDGGISHTYQEHAGGHEWSYWNRYLADTLRHVDRHCHSKGAL